MSLMLSPLKFIYVCGLAIITFSPEIIPSPITALCLSLVKPMPVSWASRSMVSKPILCLVASYFFSGLPSPAIRYLSLAPSNLYFFYFNQICIARFTSHNTTGNNKLITLFQVKLLLGYFSCSIEKNICRSKLFAHGRNYTP